MSTTEQGNELEPNERVQRLKAFTCSEFLSIISRTKADRPCEACGSEIWVTPSDENDKPTIVKMPILETNEVAVQLYIPRLCTKCANTRFFNVGWLLDGLSRAGKSDEQ